jgi:hypothetical protein
MSSGSGLGIIEFRSGSGLGDFNPDSHLVVDDFGCLKEGDDTLEDSVVESLGDGTNSGNSNLCSVTMCDDDDECGEEGGAVVEDVDNVEANVTNADSTSVTSP